MADEERRFRTNIEFQQNKNDMMIHDIRREQMLSGKDSSMAPPGSKGFLTQSSLAKMGSPKLNKIRTLDSLKGPKSQERVFEDPDTTPDSGAGKKNVLSRHEIRGLLEETISKMKSHNNKEK